MKLYAAVIALTAVMVLSCTADPQQETPSAGNPSDTSQSTAQNQGNTVNTDRVQDMQSRLRNGQNSGDSTQPQRFRVNIEPYASFLDEDGYLSFDGISTDELTRVLGEAPVVVRQAVPGAPVRREVRVYLPYEQDSTGLYIFIRNEEVEFFTMDTFLGLANSSVISEYFANN